MSEVDLTALATLDKTEEKDEHKPSKAKALTPMQEANEVLEACGFGWFHVRLLMTSFFGVSTTVCVSNTPAYILANAECDLGMSLVQKGVLNAMIFVGMFISTIPSGFMSDAFGRKIIVLVGYGASAIFTLTTALSQNFAWICTSKLLEGVAFAAAMSPIHAYTSECCHSGIRDRLVLLQASYMSLCQVWLALYSWGVLTQDWTLSLFNGAFVLYTWNIYLFITVLTSLMTTILFIFLPESPKYLVLQHRYKEAKEALTLIYKENTRKSADSFPYKDLWKNRINEQTIYEDSQEEKGSWVAFKRQLVTGFHNCKPLFRNPLLGHLILFCSLNFLIMSMYNVLRLWFPQLSTIVEHYSHDPAHNSDLCSMLEAYVDDTYHKNETVSTVCVPNKSGTQTYINSLILGLICIPPFLLTGVLVNKLGKKLLLLISGLCTIAATLGLKWSSGKYEVVGLISLDVGMGQIMLSLMQATTVEIFPTSTRSLSVSFLMMAGRIGSMVGNVLFPILLNLGCGATFYTIAGIMIIVTIMVVFLPKKKS